MRIGILKESVAVDSDFGGLSKHALHLEELLISKSHVCMMSTHEIILFSIEGNILWAIKRSIFSPDIVQGMSWGKFDKIQSSLDQKLTLVVHTYPNDRDYQVALADGSIISSSVVRG